MDQITLRLDESLKTELDNEAEEKGVSRSEHIRYIVESRGEIEYLREQLESRQGRIEELESQLRKRSNIEEKIEDLPEKIRGEESYTEKRRRKLDQATFPQRLKWRLTGVPVDDE
jgi:Ribbon-helix-helix protein, copG family.